MLKKKVTTEEVVEEVTTEETTVEDEVVDENVALKRLTNATAVVKAQFHLGDDYVITKFNDKGRSIDLTLSNTDFTISITIKDTELYGIE